MDRQQAIQALNEGKTLTHKYFASDEWVRGIYAGMYLFEDGIKCSATEFWRWRQDSGFDSGWSEKL